MDLLGSRQLRMELPMHHAKPLHRVHHRALLLGLTLVACDPAKLGTLDAEATGSTGGDDADPSDTASDDAGSQSGPATSSTSSGPSGDDASTSPPDVGSTSDDSATSSTTTTDGDPTGVDGEACDVFLQDCADGEKCNPWANDGGAHWNAFACFPVDDNAGSFGDECLVEGSGTSGVDNCALGALCWDVDPESNAGTCTELCQGTADDPVCTTPGTSCVTFIYDSIPLCLPVCDPLLQDCGDGEACAPLAAFNFLIETDTVFGCVPDIAEDSGDFGDLCNLEGECNAGFACTASVPGCPEDQDNCCSPFCDLTEVSPCPDLLTCVPWFEEGLAPIGLENVGLCS